MKSIVSCALIPAVGLLALTLAAPAVFADPYAALAKYQFGQSREPLADIEAQIRKTPASGYKEIEGRLLAVLRSAETTKDAKRYICRWLAVVGSGACVPAVAELLTDEDLSHPARMALEPNPDPSAGAALRNALPKVKGKLRIGVISSIGARRDGEAVGALGRLAADGDPSVAGAAISALGQIGTPEAAEALESLQAPAGLSRTLARARITAANHLAAAGKKAEAVRVFRALMDSGQPKAVRTAAVEGLVSHLPGGEAAALVGKLAQGGDAALRAAAVAVCAHSRNKELKTAVAQRLPDMAPAAQLALLVVLADDPEAPLRTPALAILGQAKELQVRMAALDCLARHGEAADVPLVVRLARAPEKPLAERAAKVLDRMAGPGIDDALVRLLESADAADRQVVLAALANRRVASALPSLVRLLNAPDSGVAAVAAKALGAMGTPEQLPPLLAALTGARNPELQAAAGEAVEKICASASDKRGASAALLAALDKAPTPAARSSVLRLLAFTRGEEALAAVRKAIEDPDEEVRETAIRTLVAWPEAAAAPHLIALAKSPRKPAHAVLALRDGCLRLANLKEVPLAERLAIYRGVLQAAQRAEEKKQAIAGLAQLPSLGALELLQTCANDPSLASDATSAVIRLARQLGPVYPQQAKAALEEIKARAASPEVVKQAEEALDSLKNVGQSPDGFILAWLLSGPYVQEGKDGPGLFDIRFAPETPGAKAEWRPAIVPPGSGPRLVEMDKILGGNNRVCYLKTVVASTKEQDALLELGSDDGVKVWLNGQVVHANNAVRPCSPDQDKVKVKLRQGQNTLLLKITQGGGEWSACCRLRALDGKPLSGITISPGEP